MTITNVSQVALHKAAPLKVNLVHSMYLSQASSDGVQGQKLNTGRPLLHRYISQFSKFSSYIHQIEILGHIMQPGVHTKNGQLYIITASSCEYVECRQETSEPLRSTKML